MDITPDSSSHTPHPILSAFTAKHAQKLPLASRPPAPCRPELRHHSPDQEHPRNRGPLHLPQPPQRLFSTQQVTWHLSQTHHVSAHNPRWSLSLHRCLHGQRNVLRKNLLRTMSKKSCSELRVQGTASTVSHRTRQTILRGSPWLLVNRCYSRSRWS